VSTVTGFGIARVGGTVVVTAGGKGTTTVGGNAHIGRTEIVIIAYGGRLDTISIIARANFVQGSSSSKFIST